MKITEINSQKFRKRMWGKKRSPVVEYIQSLDFPGYDTPMCPYCGSEDLQTRRFLKDGREYSCNDCDRWFKRKEKG